MEVYSSTLCPFCWWANHLLRDPDLEFSVCPVGGDLERRTEMIMRSGAHTAPQIFIDELPLGGFDEPKALDVEKGSGLLLKLERQPSS